MSNSVDFFLKRFKSGSQPVQSPLRSEDQPLIALKGVTKAFKSPAGDFLALKNINLEIGSGEFVAVQGKSGAGKSTLINMVTGIGKPSEGKIRVGSHLIHEMNEAESAKWRGVNAGVVFQSFQLLPMLTCVQNVMLPMDFANLYRSTKERRERALHLLDLVGIADQADKLPSAVSGGQRQRVAIARALANDPSFLAADEPTGNLDSNTADAVFQVFQKLVDQGVTILMVTHDREMASRCSRVLHIADGELVGMPESVVTESQPTIGGYA